MTNYEERKIDSADLEKIKLPEKAYVMLASMGNPDHKESPYFPYKNSEPNRNVPVNTLKEAVRECMKFIEKNNLGGGNWSGGDIMLGKRKLYSVSYNGRVWIRVKKS